MLVIARKQKNLPVNMGHWVQTLYLLLLMLCHQDHCSNTETLIFVCVSVFVFLTDYNLFSHPAESLIMNNKEPRTHFFSKQHPSFILKNGSYNHRVIVLNDEYLLLYNQNSAGSSTSKWLWMIIRLRTCGLAKELSYVILMICRRSTAHIQFLMKAKRLARMLHDSDAQKWLDYEIMGYPVVIYSGEFGSCKKYYTSGRPVIGNGKDPSSPLIRFAPSGIIYQFDKRSIRNKNRCQ